MKYSEELKKNIKKRVSDGEKVTEISEKENIPTSTIYNWMRKSGELIGKKNTKDEEILDTIKENKVITFKQLKKELNLSSHSNLTKRLRYLVMKDKLSYIHIPSKLKDFLGDEYSNSNVYFTDKGDFDDWVLSKMPDKIPPKMRRILSRRLNKIGVDFSFPKTDVKNIQISAEEYRKIKEFADKNNTSVKKLVTGLVD
jgi:transposase-like protein